MSEVNLPLHYRLDDIMDFVKEAISDFDILSCKEADTYMYLTEMYKDIYEILKLVNTMVVKEIPMDGPNEEYLNSLN
jgi:hypothetical protein